MAGRRPSQPPQPLRPPLTVDEKRRCVTRLESRIKDLEAFNPETVEKRWAIPEVMTLETAIDEALSAAFGHRTVEYNRYVRATKLDHGPVVMSLGEWWFCKFLLGPVGPLIISMENTSCGRVLR